jgi:hypothetical protein
VTATLVLSEPTSLATQVTLTSSVPTVATVPTKVGIQPNTTAKTFTVDTDAVTEPVDVTITGNLQWRGEPCPIDGRADLADSHTGGAHDRQ